MANDEKTTTITDTKTEKKARTKKTSDNSTDTKKTIGKKSAAKKTETKKPSARKTTSRRSSVDSKVYVQFFGKQVTTNDVLELCKADYKNNNKAAVKNIEVYVKPEDDAAYYVVNGSVEGKVSL